MGIDVLKPIPRDSNDKDLTPMMYDTNKRSWNFRNPLLKLLNLVAMSHENQEIIDKFRTGGNPTME